MKLGELLRGTIRFVREWWFFGTASCLINYLVFFGIIHKDPTVDTELEEYVQYFKDAADLYSVKVNFNNLSVSFVDRFPEHDWVGLCQSGRGVSKFISIHKGYFKKAPPEVRYSLVAHELGHCVLGKSHVGGYLSDGCPQSIMHPSDGLFGCFFKHQDYYFKELFGLL